MTRAPRFLRKGFLIGAIGIAAAALSCTLLIETRGSQCKVDADCTKFPHAACDAAQGICVDQDCAAGDCVCAPKTPTDILNGCPKGQCAPFDNGRVKGLVNGGVPDVTGTPPMQPGPAYACGAGGGG